MIFSPKHPHDEGCIIGVQELESRNDQRKIEIIYIQRKTQK